MNRTLRDIAHIRTGDKGPLTTISVACHEVGDYPLLVAELTSEVVAAHLGTRIHGRPTRYELPKVAALLFVCRRDPIDTVNTSLHLDRHGKTIGSRLYDVELSETSDAR